LPDGWLSLVDRIVLDEGENQLPIGVLTLHGHEARFRAREGVEITYDGQPVRERTLRSDAAGRPDTLLAGGRSYELMQRGDLFFVRVKDPEAPSRLRFTSLEYFPVDPAWRIAARFEPFHPARTTVHLYDIGESGPRVVPGRVHFQVGGQALSLEPVLEEDSHRLYFVFSDTTNLGDTYPTGRFLYAAPPADGEVILDFNTAFNPPCAFTDYATCPVTPAYNRLPIAIPAGEKRYQQPG
jgi:uncharacterized protein (DUF1684 family)